VIGKAIAILILTSIALILSIALTSHIITAITPLFEKYPETLLIKGDSYITKEDGNYILMLHMFSNIKPIVIVYAIEVGGTYIRISTENTEILTVNSGHAELTNKGLSLRPGTDVWISIRVQSSFSLGNYVEVKAYTETGYVYRGMLPFR